MDDDDVAFVLLRLADIRFFAVERVIGPLDDEAVASRLSSGTVGAATVVTTAETVSFVWLVSVSGWSARASPVMRAM